MNESEVRIGMPVVYPTALDGTRYGIVGSERMIIAGQLTSGLLPVTYIQVITSNGSYAFISANCLNMYRKPKTI